MSHDPEPIDTASPTDAGFERSLMTFLARPSVAGWEILLRSVSPERRYQAARVASLRARAQGVDPTLMFHCLLRTGPAGDMLALVESCSV